MIISPTDTIIKISSECTIENSSHIGEMNVNPDAVVCKNEANSPVFNHCFRNEGTGAVSDNFTAFVTASGNLYVGEYDGSNTGSLYEVPFNGGVKDAVIFKKQLFFVDVNGYLFSYNFHGLIYSKIKVKNNFICATKSNTKIQNLYCKDCRSSLDNRLLRLIITDNSQNTCSHGLKVEAAEVYVNSLSARSDAIVFLCNEGCVWMLSKRDLDLILTKSSELFQRSSSEPQCFCQNYACNAYSFNTCGPNISNCIINVHDHAPLNCNWHCNFKFSVINAVKIFEPNRNTFIAQFDSGRTYSAFLITKEPSATNERTNKISSTKVDKNVFEKGQPSSQRYGKFVSPQLDRRVRLLKEHFIDTTSATENAQNAISEFNPDILNNCGLIDNDEVESKSQKAVGKYMDAQLGENGPIMYNDILPDKSLMTSDSCELPINVSSKEFASRQLSWMVAPVLDDEDNDYLCVHTLEQQLEKLLDSDNAMESKEESSPLFCEVKVSKKLDTQCLVSSINEISKSEPTSYAYPLETATDLIKENVYQAANTAVFAANSAVSLVTTGVRTVSDKMGMLTRHFSKSEVDELGYQNTLSADADDLTVATKLSDNEEFNTNDTVELTSKSAMNVSMLKSSNKEVFNKNDTNSSCLLKKPSSDHLRLPYGDNGGNTRNSNSLSLQTGACLQGLTSSAADNAYSNTASESSSDSVTEYERLEQKVKTSVPEIFGVSQPLNEKDLLSPLKGKTHIRSSSAVFSFNNSVVSSLGVKATRLTESQMKKSGSVDSLLAGKVSLDASVEAINKSYVFANIGKSPFENIDLMSSYNSGFKSGGVRNFLPKLQVKDDKEGRKRSSQAESREATCFDRKRDVDVDLNLLVNSSWNYQDVEVLVWGQVSPDLSFASPTCVVALSGHGITKIVCGDTFLAALTVYGTVLVWGNHKLSENSLRSVHNKVVDTSTKASQRKLKGKFDHSSNDSNDSDDGYPETTTPPAFDLPLPKCEDSEDTNIRFLSLSVCTKKLFESALTESGLKNTDSIYASVSKFDFEKTGELFNSNYSELGSNSSCLEEAQKEIASNMYNKEFCDSTNLNGNSISVNKSELEELKPLLNSSSALSLSSPGQAVATGLSRVHDIGCGGTGALLLVTLEGNLHLALLGSTCEEIKKDCGKYCKPPVAKDASCSLPSGLCPRENKSEDDDKSSDGSVAGECITFHRVEMGVGEKCCAVLSSGDSVIASAGSLSSEFLGYLRAEDEYLEALLLVSTHVLQPLLRFLSVGSDDPPNNLRGCFKALLASNHMSLSLQEPEFSDAIDEVALLPPNEKLHLAAHDKDSSEANGTDSTKIMKKEDNTIEEDSGSSGETTCSGSSATATPCKSEPATEYCQLCSRNNPKIFLQLCSAEDVRTKAAANIVANGCYNKAERCTDVVNNDGSISALQPLLADKNLSNAPSVTSIASSSASDDVNADTGRKIKAYAGYRDRRCRDFTAFRTKSNSFSWSSDGLADGETSQDRKLAETNVDDMKHQTLQAAIEMLLDICRVTGHCVYTTALHASGDTPSPSDLPLVKHAELLCRLYAQYVDTLCDCYASLALSPSTTDFDAVVVGRGIKKTSVSHIECPLKQEDNAVTPDPLRRSREHHNAQEKLDTFGQVWTRDHERCWGSFWDTLVYIIREASLALKKVLPEHLQALDFSDDGQKVSKNSKDKSSSKNGAQFTNSPKAPKKKGDKISNCTAKETSIMSALSVFEWILKLPLERISQYVDFLGDIVREMSNSQICDEKDLKEAHSLWRKLFLLADKYETEATQTQSFWQSLPQYDALMAHPTRRILLDSRTQGPVKLSIPTVNSSRFLPSLTLSSTSCLAHVVLLSDTLLHFSAGASSKHSYTSYSLDSLWTMEASVEDVTSGTVISVLHPEIGRLQLTCCSAASCRTWRDSLCTAITAACNSTRCCGFSACSLNGRGVLAEWLKSKSSLSPVRSSSSRTVSFNFTKHALFAGATYTGQWLSAKPHGLGTLFWPNGTCYTGSFKDGVYHGTGTLVVQTAVDDDFFTDDVFMPLANVGSLQGASSCTGEWMDGAMHGWGQIKYFNGDTYSGWLTNNLFDKHGVLQRGNMRRSLQNNNNSSNSVLGNHRTSCTDNNKHSETVQSKAENKTHRRTSKASVAKRRRSSKKVVSLDANVVVASVYTGEWQCGAKHGYGVEDDIGSGTKYIGMHQQGEKHGPGVVMTLHGAYYETSFISGKIAGLGLAIMEDGSVFEGEFGGVPKISNSNSCNSSVSSSLGLLEPHCCGRGSLYYVSGDVIHGQFSGPLMNSVGATVAGPLKINNAVLYREGVVAGPPESLPSPCRLGQFSPSVHCKWSALFSHYEELLGLHEALGNRDLVWRNLARYIANCSGRIATSGGISNTNVTFGANIDVISTIPAMFETLDCRSLLQIQEYLSKAFNTPPHPLHELLSHLVASFRATYGGCCSTPALLLPHALQEIRYFTSRLYRLVRALFPVLPPEGTTLRLDHIDIDADQEQSEGGGPSSASHDMIVVTASCMVHTWLLPHLYSPLSTLYVLCGADHNLPYDRGHNAIVPPQFAYPLPETALASCMKLSSAQLGGLMQLQQPNLLCASGASLGGKMKTVASLSCLSIDKDTENCVSDGVLRHPLLRGAVSLANDITYWHHLCLWNEHSDDAILDALEVDREFRPTPCQLLQRINDCSAEHSNSPDTHIGTASSQYLSKGVIFAEAIEVFQLLSTAFLPRAKLAIVQQTFRTIKRLVSEVGSAVPHSLDVLLPVFMYCVIRARVQRLGVELSLMDDLLEHDFKRGELDFMYTNLTAAYYHICQNPPSVPRPV